MKLLNELSEHLSDMNVEWYLICKEEVFYVL